MKVNTLASYFVLMLSAISMIVPMAKASKTYRTLGHPTTSKNSKKSHKGKLDTKKANDHMNYLPFSMSMDDPDFSLDMRSLEMSLDMSYAKCKGKSKDGKKESHKS